MLSHIAPIFIAAIFVFSHGFTVAFGHDLNGTVLKARATSNSSWPELQDLLDGNQRFRDRINAEHPGLFKELSTGQHPGVLYLGCVDSRVSDGGVFDSLPGQIFATRNIANQFHSEDVSALSTVAYGVKHLGVKHILVMGHYGCGGVSAAITSAHTTKEKRGFFEPFQGYNVHRPDLTGSRQRLQDPQASQQPEDTGEAAINTWIEPVIELYLSSNRSEIVALREANAGKTTVDAPDVTDLGFRALIEENVKVSVANLVAEPTIASRGNFSNAKREEAEQIYVHGWVYDVANGEITNLNITQGPF